MPVLDPWNFALYYIDKSTQWQVNWDIYMYNSSSGQLRRWFAKAWMLVFKSWYACAIVTPSMYEFVNVWQTK